MDDKAKKNLIFNNCRHGVTQTKKNITRPKSNCNDLSATLEKKTKTVK